MRFLLFLSLLFVACATPACSMDTAKVSVAKSEELIGEKVQLLDVRTKEEWDEGHLEGAVMVDITQKGFDEKVKKTLDPEKPTLIYCRSGSRSAAAEKQLKTLGFKTLYDMDGGIIAWKAAKKKVVK